MKKMIIIVASLVLALQVSATNLRGQLLHRDAGGSQPLAGVRVDLMIWNGTQWVDMAFAITDTHGFYYFLNYDPNKKFFVSVAGKYYPPQPITILNIEPPQYQDIPAITN